MLYCSFCDKEQKPTLPFVFTMWRKKLCNIFVVLYCSFCDKDQKPTLLFITHRYVLTTGQLKRLISFWPRKQKVCVHLCMCWINVELSLFHLAGTKVIGAHSMQEMVGKLKKPRRVMMLVKAGSAVDAFIDQLVSLLRSMGNNEGK